MERQSALEITPDDWSRVMDTNLRGPFFIAQAAAKWMMEHDSRVHNGGIIVNIADLSALHPWPSYVTHTISKSGIVAMTKVLALALAPVIRVNAVAPGAVLKPTEWSDERWEKMIESLPLQHGGTAQDVADAVLYCVHNDFMTGQIVVMDGGRSLRA